MRAVVADHAERRRASIGAELERQGLATELVADDTQLGDAEGASLVLIAWSGDGRGALAACRRLRSGTSADEPVVVLVGAGDDLDVDAALEAGASDVWALAEDLDATDISARIALARNYARLQVEHLRVGGQFALMREALDLSGTGFVLTDPRLEDDPIVYANRFFYELTGYGPDEVLGHNCRFLQGPKTQRDRVARIREALRADRPVQENLLNYRKDGSVFHNEVHVAPVRDERGQVVRRVGVQVDVTAYHEQNRRLGQEQRARRNAEARARRSSFLAGASPALDATLDEITVARELAKLAIGQMGEACLVWFDHHDTLDLVHVRATDPTLEADLAALVGDLSADPGSRVAGVADAGGETIGIGDAAGPVAGEEVDALLRRAAGAAPSWILCPLAGRGRALGVLALARLGHDFDATDLDLASELADRGSLALDNARLYREQGDAARALQASFLPEALPDVPDLQLEARYRPADTTIDLGGDFYDARVLRDGTIALAVGDVTGKGPAAAAVTSLCRHTLRVALDFEPDPVTALDALNRALLEQQAGLGRYATAVVCTLRPQRDGDYELTTVCAGHPSPRIVRADGRVELAGHTGMLLGWRDPPLLERHRTRLHAHDTLVCFTDGVASGTAAGPLSVDDLHELLAAQRDRPLAGGLDELDRAAHAAQATGHADDVVLLAARPLGGFLHRDAVVGATATRQAS